MSRLNITAGFFIIFVLLCAIPQLVADDDWGQLENALRNAGIIGDKTQPQNQGSGSTTPPAGNQNQNPQPPQTPQTPPTGTGNSASTTPTTQPTGSTQPSGPVWPTNPDGTPVPIPAGSAPHGPGLTIGEYESEGGKLWRDFRDGKLTADQYKQKMNELRDRLERERQERERREAELPEAKERARIAREEAEARARHYRREAEQRRREREREEREAREKKVSQNPFQPAESIGELASGPNVRDMDSNFQKDRHQEEHHHRD